MSIETPSAAGVGNDSRILVTGATGKTGRRVADRLATLGHPVRTASRSTSLPFDWDDPAGWPAVLQGIAKVYLTYSPDLALPEARPAIRRFVAISRELGVQHVVLLSGRGEPDAQACEQIVMEGGMDWTIVRASWFNQNFSEGAFVDMVRSGEIALPAGDTPEPFVDADDIADVAVAALTENGHAGEVYDVTGPRLLTFADVASELAAASGRPMTFVDIPHAAFADGLRRAGTPETIAGLLDYLFATVLDGRNARLGDGVQRALNRAPRDFRDYARQAAAGGAWDNAAA